MRRTQALTGIHAYAFVFERRLKGRLGSLSSRWLFSTGFLKRLVHVGIGAYKRVEKLWEKALVGWIDFTFRTSDQSL